MKQLKSWWGVLAVLLLSVLVLLPQLLVFSATTSYGDEGVAAQVARRIAQGEVPFRDFFCAVTPGSFYWTAGFLALFGKTFLVLRLSALATFVLILVGTSLVLQRLRVRELSSYAMTLLFLAFAYGYWFIPSHHWVSLACCLFSLALLLRPAADHGKAGLGLVLAGVAAALAAFSLQHKGVVWIVAATIALGAGQPAGEQWRALKKFWLGIALAALPLVLFFVYSAGLPALVEQLLLFPLKQYHKADAHRDIPLLTDLLRNWTIVSSSWASAASVGDYLKHFVWLAGFVGRVVVHVLPLVGAWALVVLWRDPRVSRGNLALLTAFFAAIYLSVLYRIHETSLFFAAPAAVIVLAYSVDLACADRETAGTRRPAVFSGARSAWIGFFAWTCCGVALMQLVLPSFTAKMPAGTVRCQFEDQAETLRQVDRFMRQYRRAGEPIFCYSYNPIFYFLLDANNPTPFDILNIPMNTQAQADHAQALLEKARCRWVVWDYTSLWLDPFGQYLNNNYEIKARFSNVAILERRPAPGFVQPN